jgi:SAM-dependent methyltransferase
VSESQLLPEETRAAPRSLLPSWDSGRFDIPVDVALFEQLTEEMTGQDETARPADWWMLPQSYLVGNMEGMLNPWCGDIGQIPLGDPDLVASVSGSAELLPLTWEFCNQIDHLGLLREHSLESLAKLKWRVVDLFSVIDALLISAFCETGDRPRVLEIGGGFGRTAEFLSKSIYPSMRYVNVEAVPISLTYCFQYLRSRFPEKKVSIITRDSEVDTDSDFLVVPTWSLSKLERSAFDISINIESFQEMSQPIIDFYISLIDRLSPKGSYVYLINARNYKFKGAFNFPTNWNCVYRHQSPHAWSKIHPTEIYKVTESSAAARNQIRRVMFDRERSLHAVVDQKRQASEAAEGAAREAASRADHAIARADEASARANGEAELRMEAERKAFADREAKEAAEESARANGELRMEAERKAFADREAREAAEESARQAAARAAASKRTARSLRKALIAVAGVAILVAAAVVGWAR